MTPAIRKVLVPTDFSPASGDALGYGVACAAAGFKQMKTVTHDGEEWQLQATGGAASVEGYSIGILFTSQTTRREAFGRLRGLPPEHFHLATDDQLRAALIAALAGDDD